MIDSQIWQVNKKLFNFRLVGRGALCGRLGAPSVSASTSGPFAWVVFRVARREEEEEQRRGFR